MVKTKINIADLEFIRAGSDYLGVAWSANVIGEHKFEMGVPVELIREDGSSYDAYPLKREKMDGQTTWLITDLDGAMMFAF